VRSFLGLSGDGTGEGGGMETTERKTDREKEKDGLFLLFARKKREDGGLRGLNCLGLLHKLRDVRVTSQCLKK
jgi:hypothetical protein